MEYEAVGTEVLPQQLRHYTEEVHSYLVLNGTLGVAIRPHASRTAVKWEGTIEWHMDSKSVIDTYPLDDREI
jgi:hypothetical protein